MTRYDHPTKDTCVRRGCLCNCPRCLEGRARFSDRLHCQRHRSNCHVTCRG